MFVYKNFIRWRLGRKRTAGLCRSREIKGDEIRCQKLFGVLATVIMKPPCFLRVLTSLHKTSHSLDKSNRAEKSWWPYNLCYSVDQRFFCQRCTTASFPYSQLLLVKCKLKFKRLSSEAGSWDSVVGIATRLLAGRCGVHIPAGATDLSLLQNVHTGSGAIPSSFSLGTRVISSA